MTMNGNQTSSDLYKYTRKYQITMLYIWKQYNVLCQLHLSKKCINK